MRFDKFASSAETANTQAVMAVHSEARSSVWARIETVRHAAWLRRFLLSMLIASFILAGAVLGLYSADAVPTSYIFRPLIVVVLLALLVAAFATLSGRWAHAVAGAVSAAIAVFPVAHLLIGFLALSIVVTKIGERRGRRWVLPSLFARITLVCSAIFFILGALWALNHVDQPVAFNSFPHGQGPSLYLILVDGYPRADTLSQDLGIDNGPFLTQLTNRGFDVYEDSHSARVHTALTLLSLLNASEADVAFDLGTADDKRAVRRLLDDARLPRIAIEDGYEYVVVDSPVGHVTFNAGRHIRHGVINNFEERLLALSPLAAAISEFAPYALTSALREHLDRSLTSIVELTEPDAGRLVLGHIMAPHLPFLYAGDGSPVSDPPYWPERHAFLSYIEEMGTSFDYYRQMYPGHLRVVNGKLLDTIDSMLARDPDAVIVLFSDHGSRFSIERSDEWSRSFLAARTPGSPNLFGESPSTTNVLCDLFVAYLDLPCR